MSKAEDRALERFPTHKGASKEWIEMHIKGVCTEYIEGHQQAEKDLELTWEDIHAISIIEDKLIHELCLNDQTLPHTQEFYEEVLKRFKTKKEESC